MNVSDNDVTSLLGRCNNSFDRLQSLVNEMNEFSKSSKLNKKETDLNILVRNSLYFLEDEAKAHNISLKFKPESKKIVFICDSDKLDMVIINIVRNAIQALGENGEITVDLVQAGEKLTIAIHDNGPGIPKDTLETIFEPFFTTKDSGTGLGLAICKEIIEQHDGTIEVKSIVGEGTTFRLII